MARGWGRRFDRLQFDHVFAELNLILITGWIGTNWKGLWADDIVRAQQQPKLGLAGNDTVDLRRTAAVADQSRELQAEVLRCVGNGHPLAQPHCEWTIEMG